MAGTQGSSAVKGSILSPGGKPSLQLVKLIFAKLIWLCYKARQGSFCPGKAGGGDLAPPLRAAADSGHTLPECRMITGG